MFRSLSRNPLPLSANILSRQPPEIKSPIQAEIPAERLALYTRINLFKEFTIIETCGEDRFFFFFLSGMESALLKLHLLVAHRAPHLSVCFFRSCANQPGVYSLEYYTPINLLLLPYILFFTSRFRQRSPEL